MAEGNKKIVVLGAGFGGLHAAVKLGGALKRGRLKGYEVILIDKNAYHTYTPMLYETATTSKDTANFLDLRSIATFPIAKIIKHLPIRFIEDEVTQIDLSPIKESVYLKSGYNLKYDYLMIALGSVSNSSAFTHSNRGASPLFHAACLSASMTEMYASFRVKEPVVKYLPTSAMRTGFFTRCVFAANARHARRCLPFGARP